MTTSEVPELEPVEQTPAMGPNPSDVANEVPPARDPRDDSDITGATSPFASSPSTDGGSAAATTAPADGSTSPTAEPAAQAEPADERQRWVCVTPEGPRTACPPFHSDQHLVGALVKCPNCGGWSVRNAGPAE